MSHLVQICTCLRQSQRSVDERITCTRKGTMSRLKIWRRMFDPQRSSRVTNQKNYDNSDEGEEEMGRNKEFD